jgi:hypothetical protein
MRAILHVNLSVAHEPNGRYSDIDSFKLTGWFWAEGAFGGTGSIAVYRGAPVPDATGGFQTMKPLDDPMKHSKDVTSPARNSSNSSEYGDHPYQAVCTTVVSIT